jgi:hypothetical protein
VRDFLSGAYTLLGHAEPWARVTPWGQLIGAIIMFWILGFIPGYALSWILKRLDVLRIPRELELAGLDYLMTTTAVREDDEIKAVLLKEVHASATAE